MDSKKSYRGLILFKDEQSSEKLFSITFLKNGNFDINYDDKDWNEFTEEEIEGILSTLINTYRSLIEYTAMSSMFTPETTHDA